MSKFTKPIVALVLIAMLAAACATPTAAPTEAPTAAAPAICGDAKAGDTLTVMYQWSGAEEEKINAIFKPFVDA